MLNWSCGQRCHVNIDDDMQQRKDFVSTFFLKDNARQSSRVCNDMPCQYSTDSVADSVRQILLHYDAVVYMLFMHACQCPIDVTDYSYKHR